jgi:hypothetical protein
MKSLMQCDIYIPIESDRLSAVVHPSSVGWMELGECVYNVCMLLRNAEQEKAKCKRPE